MSSTDTYLANNSLYAESFTDLDEDVRQSIARIKASPFVPHTDSVRGFVFDVATGCRHAARPHAVVRGVDEPGIVGHVI